MSERLEMSHAPDKRMAMLQSFAYAGGHPTAVRPSPENLGYERIGHFNQFQARHAAGFGLDTVLGFETVSTRARPAHRSRLDRNGDDNARHQSSPHQV